MEILMEMTPRAAGATAVETDIVFDMPDPLHDVVACAGTCQCWDGTYSCPNTGRSYVAE
ncbi:hypothetical protein [Nocardia panacis]|uniref:hypothetical protein n=1 Tax=Nocardia panacis TaxID=2340916 RepID=UPI0013153186|nr:hypothetical protein [Nocardia panacis]